jgi:hypothetical protein
MLPEDAADEEPVALTVEFEADIEAAIAGKG